MILPFRKIDKQPRGKNFHFHASNLTPRCHIVNLIPGFEFNQFDPFNLQPGLRRRGR
jgi:hypothetical protein